MNKAPVTQPTQVRRSIWPRSKSPGMVLPVAEALTEEEAAKALADQKSKDESQRITREEKERAKAAARAEKEARKLAKQAAKQVAVQAAREARQAVGAPPPVSSQGGRLNFSIGTSGMVAAAGALCILAFGAYTIGRKSSNEPGKLGTVAATTAPGPQKTGSPLLPRSESRTPVVPKPMADAVKSNPDLQHLLKRPPLAEQRVAANQPLKVDATPSPAESVRPENLNYLQIESFLITRDRSGEQLAQDLTDARRFLLSKGVRTFARKRSNGYVLFAEDGFPPGKDHREARGEFKRKLERLGAEYRSQGGLYQFKGCLFVSYSATKAGDPV